MKHSEVRITGLKIRKDEENRMNKRTGINYGRKYAAITLAAVTAACTGASAGSAVTVAAAEENKTLVYAGESESTINPLLNNHDELPDLIFSGLMKYDANGKPVEDLAESYTFDRDTIPILLSFEMVLSGMMEKISMQRMLYTPIRSLQRMKPWEPVSPATIRTLQALRHRMIRR